MGKRRAAGAVWHGVRASVALGGAEAPAVSALGCLVCREALLLLLRRFLTEGRLRIRAARCAGRALSVKSGRYGQHPNRFRLSSTDCKCKGEGAMPHPN